MIAGGMIAGFLLGAAGSLHCIGMCGPLSLALPVHHLSSTKKFFVLLTYQFGRIATYSLMGFILGWTGHKIYMAGFQQWFSIIMGALILIMAALYFLNKRLIRFSFLDKFYFRIQKIIAHFLVSAKNPLGFFLVGMANGLLPCGIVYIAMASALSFNSVAESTGFMAMFGAGTLPAMMMVAYAGQVIRPELRFSLKKIIPYFIAAMGIVLVLRGLNLGIPFISPHLPASPEQTVVCH
jgi:sulfite exporter TauE/SafE